MFPHVSVALILFFVFVHCAGGLLHRTTNEKLAGGFQRTRQSKSCFKIAESEVLDVE